MKFLTFLCSLAILLAASESHAQKKPLPEVKNPTPPAKTGELPLKAVRAFPELRFDRPIIVTSAPGQPDRVYVAEQKGRIVYFDKNQDASEAKVFCDLTSKVMYKDKENEEGLLGLAFHPDYEKDGRFFTYHTTRSKPHTSVLMEHWRDEKNPLKCDPKHDTVLMTIPQPFWNHNGGTICFGPDGYLYIALGDGGSANDPLGNGQNTQTLLGSILRIDINGQTKGQSYIIPADNPFTDKPKEGRPEIFAWGLRNVWRMDFDSKTGKLWAADVGQNLWEEINIIEKGGNYGWNHREGLHNFGKEQHSAADYIDPVWEYYHTIGKSVTGGFVYRGSKLPQLEGMYLYADYVTGQLYALDYDHEKGKAVGNYTIEGPKLPVMSFGQDADGEPYFTTTFGLLYTFEAK